MPENKKPLQGEPVRGDVSILQASCNDNIPDSVIQALRREMQGVSFGGVSLIISIRDGHATFRVEKTISLLTGGIDGI